jgi:hypothetical protein
MDILLPVHYESIREELSLTADELPNEAIARESILGLAEIKVKAAIPDWESLTSEEDEIYLRLATLHYVCYLLGPRLPALLLEVETDNKTTFKRFKGFNFRSFTKGQFGQYKVALKNISTYVSVDTTDALFVGSPPGVDTITGV